MTVINTSPAIHLHAALPGGLGSLAGGTHLHPVIAGWETADDEPRTAFTQQAQIRVFCQPVAVLPRSFGHYAPQLRHDDFSMRLHATSKGQQQGELAIGQERSAAHGSTFGRAVD